MTIINVREKNILEGARKLVCTIAPTIGPLGRKCLLDKGFNVYTEVSDGFQLAKVINLVDENENKGVEILKQAAIKTHERVGDGSSMSIILAYEIIMEGIKNIEAGISYVRINNGLRKALNVCEEYLDEIACPADLPEVLRKVAVTAAKDRDIIEKISWVFQEVCNGKSVIIEESSDSETIAEIQSGMAIDNGYSSPYFANNTEESDLELENVYVLMTDKEISDFKDLIPVIEYVCEQSASLLILSAGVTGDALANLLLNVNNNALKAVSVIAGAYGYSGNDVLEDAAVYTGGQFVSKQSYNFIKDWKHYLGRAKKVAVKQNGTMIFGGHGKAIDVARHIATLEDLYQNEENKAQRISLRNRMRRLSDERIVIKVGGKTDVECQDNKNKYEKAFASVHGAYNFGVCPGGGVAYLSCINELQNLLASLPYEERIGVLILIKALEAPAKYILKNAGLPADKIVAELESSKSGKCFDICKGDFYNASEGDVLDSARVLKEALSNAVSVAIEFLSAEIVVINNN